MLYLEHSPPDHLRPQVLAASGLDPPLGFGPGPVSGVRVGAFFLGVLSTDMETQQGFVPCRGPPREDGAPQGPLPSALNVPGPQACRTGPGERGAAARTRGGAKLMYLPRDSSELITPCPPHLTMAEPPSVVAGGSSEVPAIDDSRRCLAGNCNANVEFETGNQQLVIYLVLGICLLEPASRRAAGADPTVLSVGRHAGRATRSGLPGLHLAPQLAALRSCAHPLTAPAA